MTFFFRPRQVGFAKLRSADRAGQFRSRGVPSRAGRSRGVRFERLEGRAMLSVSGDFNGDGFDDLAVGAPGETVAGLQFAGSVTIIYGSRKGLVATGNQTFRLDSPGVDGVATANGAFGFSLAAGDYNDDGRDDWKSGSHGWRKAFSGTGECAVWRGERLAGGLGRSALDTEQLGDR
jgi:hypothetical protein